MTRDDTEKLLMVTYGALSREFGKLDDFPYEFANMVANIYYRYFQLAFDSAPPISEMELLNRQSEYERIGIIVRELRRLPSEKDVTQWHIKFLISCMIDVFKYRMQNVERKTGIRRMIERQFLSHQDFPNLAKDFSLHR